MTTGPEAYTGEKTLYEGALGDSTTIYNPIPHSSHNLTTRGTGLSIKPETLKLLEETLEDFSEQDLNSLGNSSKD